MTKQDMDAETLAALNASIAKWEKNARVWKWESVRITDIDCPLCALFHRLGCEGCPVAETSRDVFCRSTPYEKALEARGQWRDGTGTAEEFRGAAREEVAFLKSLLPEAEQ